MTTTCSLLEEGVVGILGPLSEDNSNVVQSICDLKEIPHIEVRWDDHPINGTIINVHPYPDVLTRTYYDIITAWGWTDFVILYENDESLQRVGELLKLFNPKTHGIVVRQLVSNVYDSNFRPVLKEVWRSGATHFVLDCSVEILDEVLRQAQQVGLMTNTHHYIITNLDLHTIELTPYLYSETNVTGMRFVDPDNKDLQQIALKIHQLSEGMEAQAGWQLRLEEALTYDAITMFAEAVKSAESIASPSSISCYNNNDIMTSGTSIVNIMKSLKHPGLTGKINYDTRGVRSDFGLDIVELREGGVITVGSWNSTAKNPLNVSRNYPNSINKDLDIANMTFTVITTLTEPYGMAKESSEPLYGNDRYEGFAIDLIRELSIIRGFNYTFIIREDKKNGEYVNETGKWTGMIGDVIDGKADLAITDLTITYEREEGVDFTSPFMMLGISILYQKPKKAPPSFFSFASPFAFEVWKLLIVSCVGVGLILFVLGRLSPSEWENPYPCIEEPEFLMNQLDLRNCFWFVTGSIMQQGSEIELKSVGTRMVAGMWWFFTLLMVSSYTANLAAFLTTETPDPHFTNFKELIENAEEKGIKYGAKAGGATANFFRDKDPHTDFGKAWSFMEKCKEECMVGENKDGVAKAQKETYAFFMESISIEYETQRKCDLVQVGNRLDEKGYGLAMRKNAPYRNSLSLAILLLQNSGKIDQLKRKWWEERRGGGACLAEAEGTEGTALNLKNVEGVFWVTIGGVVLAVIFAMIETVMHTCKRSMRTKLAFWAVLKEEVMFYFKFGEMVKPVTYESSSESEESSKSKLDKKEPPYNLVDKQISIETMDSNTNSNKTKRNKKKTYDKQTSINTC